MRRVGIIDDAPMWNAFRQGLRDHGYLEGQNIAFDYKYADGVPERLAEAAAELVRRPVDVIATYGTPPTRAAKEEVREAIPSCGLNPTLRLQQREDFTVCGRLRRGQPSYCALAVAAEMAQQGRNELLVQNRAVTRAARVAGRVSYRKALGSWSTDINPRPFALTFP